MDAPAKVREDQLLEMTADIVSAFVAKNSVAADQLGGLIRSTHQALASLSSSAAAPEAPRAPAAPIKRSVRPDHIICLEDGKKFKSLKRHLRVEHGLSPSEYRARWGLPGDFPMVAPEYAERRSQMAKSIGLGRKTKRPARRKAAVKA